MMVLENEPNHQCTELHRIGPPYMRRFILLKMVSKIYKIFFVIFGFLCTLLFAAVSLGSLHVLSAFTC